VITQLASGGGSIQLGSLDPTRDFSFVSDTVNGFISAIGCEGSLGQVLNLGSGFEISVGETVQLIAEIMGATSEVLLQNERVRPALSEVERLWADNTKASNVLDWQPAFRGIEGFKRGLVETVEWFSDPANLLRYKTNVYNV